MGAPLDDGVAAVRARLAHAILRRTHAPQRVGEFALRPDQVASVSRIRAAFAEFGGAILADPPGTGKTVTALAVADSFAEVLVVLPAALRAQWSRAAERATVRVRLISFEALSRAARPSRADLVIVDEAHHARTPTTARYRALAETCAGARILLLSATPVVNRQADLQALLALFLGARAGTLSAAESARLILRHRPDAGLRPRVVRGLALRGAADVAGLGIALAQLPPALPVADGAPAVALTRISLAFAWCSSLAALDAALRRRIQRGTALQHALEAGRWPSRDALREWVISDDSMQLAMAELLVPFEDRPSELSMARDVLATHLLAVRAMRELVRPHLACDTAARADAIRAILDDRRGERAVVFARHADTIRALWREFRGDAGTVALTGARVEAAAGRWTRDEVLRALAPTAATPASRAHRSIQLLLTTDLLSEGVDMPAVRTVVHGDLAWTPARLEQRRGRITRAVSAGGEVREFTFAPPAGAVPFIRLAERLRRKRATRDRVLCAATETDDLNGLLTEWTADEGVFLNAGEAVAAVGADVTGFIVALRERHPAGDGSRSLTAFCGWQSEGQWRTSNNPRAMLRIVRQAQGAAIAATPEAVSEIHAVVARATRRFEALERVGGRGGASHADSTIASRGGALTRRLADRFWAIIQRAPHLERAGLALVERDLRLALAKGMGSASESALVGTLRSAPTPDDFVAQVRTILAATRSAGRPTPSVPALSTCHVPEIEALLILIPPATPKQRPHQPAGFVNVPRASASSSGN